VPPGSALPTCFTGHPVGRSALEEAFAAWLATYRDGELGSTLASHFLTVDHLLAAFAAGWEAVAGYQDPSESLMS